MIRLHHIHVHLRLWGNLFKSEVTVLPHPPHSHIHLAQYSFPFFQKSGRSYKSLQTIDSAASHRIRDLFSRAIGRKISSYLQHKFLRALCRTDLIYLSISAYRVAFQKWIQRLKSCISFRGEYFERMSFLFHFLNQFLLRFLYNTRYVLKTLVHMALTRSF